MSLPSEEGAASSRRRILVPIGVGIAVVLCILALDRPLALWLNRAFRDTRTFELGAVLLRPLDHLLVPGAVLLVVAALWKASGHAPPVITRFLAAAAAAVLTLLVTVAVKLALGRSQVFPPFLRDHVYAFHWFSGSKDYAAFPSGIMSAATALAAGAGPARGFETLAAIVVVVVLAALLLVTNSHWLSDIIGGAYLGLVLGAAVANYIRSRARAALKPASGADRTE